MAKDKPTIIQGGMGVGVSNWRLAREVSMAGQLGVVSGTVIDTVVARLLQLGDPGGHLQRALQAFPVPQVAERVLDKYYIPGGKAPDAPFKRIPLYSIHPNPELVELTVAANFCEVYLAKEGHSGLVGINYLEKLQIPNLCAFYGAMLAGVDYVLMGAGIPIQVPGLLDGLSQHQPVQLRLTVDAAEPGDNYYMEFDPTPIGASHLPPLKRPDFLAIVSSHVLATMLLTKSSGKVNGFIVEGPTAGGHNAPPRGAMQLNEKGEPVYGQRDEVDLAGMRKLGSPFWLAGSFATLGKLKEALQEGAEGIQVGTAFALSKDSGLTPQVKSQILDMVLQDRAVVFTDPLASPSGFPFKVLEMEGTMSEEEVYHQRTRICDLGYLRKAYKKEDGTIGYRCASEPLDQFTAKGGDVAETDKRKCLCNALLANIGLGQVQVGGYVEKPLITLGDDLTLVRQLATEHGKQYGARHVLEKLLGELKPASP